MKYSKLFFVTIFFLACSPYKKITLTMSEQQTTHWKGATETSVLNSLGEYKKKTSQPNGYSLRFDYSYTKVGKSNVNDKIGLRVTAANQGLTPKSSPTPDPSLRSYDANQVVKFMEFYFDDSHHVTSVYAEGYPDSVYYVKRKG